MKAAWGEERHIAPARYRLDWGADRGRTRAHRAGRCAPSRLVPSFRLGRVQSLGARVEGSGGHCRAASRFGAVAGLLAAASYDSAASKPAAAPSLQQPYSAPLVPSPLRAVAPAPPSPPRRSQSLGARAKPTRPQSFPYLCPPSRPYRAGAKSLSSPQAAFIRQKA